MREEEVIDRFQVGFSFLPENIKKPLKKGFCMCSEGKEREHWLKMC